MWFSRSSSRKLAKGQPEYPPSTSSPVKPLLGNDENYTFSHSRDSSPTKTRLVETPSSFSTIHGHGQRPDFPRSTTSPVFGSSSPLPDALGVSDAPRLSVSSSTAGHRDAPSSPTTAAAAGGASSNRFLHPGSFLQPPASMRSLKNPSFTNVVEEDEGEGGDRLFDALSGRPLATMNSTRGDALPTIYQLGSDLEVVGPGGGGVVGEGHKQSSGDLEDPAGLQMWEYLSKIRTLQAEVAALHFAMDGQALGDPWGTAKTGARSRSGSVNNLTKDGKNGFMEKNSSAPKVTIPTEPLLAKSKTRGGTKDSDEERGEDKKARIEEDFQALDKMYEDKQDILASVTAKLKELASAVRTYHELENPVISTTSRHNTLESQPHMFYDSPAPLSTNNSSPVKKSLTIETSRSAPKLSLAPILTASPLSSLPPSPLPKSRVQQAPAFPKARRISLEMGTGGGPHLYSPISPKTPAPQAFPLPPQSSNR